MDSDESEKKRGPVHRSPSYPAITLEKAVSRAREFYQHEKRSTAPVAVALKHWGYGPVSGGGRVTLAALLAFGLMRDEGAGENRQVRLTDLALRIILDDRPESVERKVALREAAQQPKIYRELLGKWPGLEISDANLRHFLLIEKKFNDGAVKDFIKDLRTTISFAELTSSPDNDAEDETLSGETISKGAEERPTPPPAQQATVAPQAPVASAKLLPQKGVGMRQEVFALAEGDVTIQWPERLSAESLEDFTDWLRILERKIKRAAQTPRPVQARPDDVSDLT